jgi:hypothetical protein
MEVRTSGQGSPRCRYCDAKGNEIGYGEWLRLYGAMTDGVDARRPRAAEAVEANRPGAECRGSLASRLEATRSEAYHQAYQQAKAAAAVAERARCRSILTHPEAQASWDLAVALALKSDVDPETAGKLLTANAVEREVVAVLDAVERVKRGLV